MKIDKNQLYTTQEVAELLKVSAITIKRYISQNKIPSKFNGIRRVRGGDLENILKSKSHAK
jgi:excisionase family DNA binding protein